MKELLNIDDIILKQEEFIIQKQYSQEFINKTNNKINIYNNNNIDENINILSIQEKNIDEYYVD